MSNYPEKLATNSLPDMEDGPVASKESKRTLRSESHPSPSRFYAIRYGVANRKPFARVVAVDADALPEPVYAHTPEGWMNVDFFADILDALARLPAAERAVARAAAH